jgi:hypothetical protein
MKNLIKQYNQFWKDMGFISYGDCFATNIFRGVFWISVICIGIYLFIEGLWLIDHIIEGKWN